MKNEIFNYNGNDITFQIGNGDVMVSATAMAKAFPEKNLTNIINSVEIQEYIQEVAKLQNYTLADLVQVTRGGNNPGTWIHKKLVLRIAQKLSPSFSVWVDDRIEELLKHGMTATPNTIEQMLDNPDALILTLQKLKEERSEKERLQLQNQKQHEQLQISAPKVDYYNEVLSSTSTYTTTLIAKELGVSATALNKRLNDLKIQYKQNEVWVLYSKYQNLGYTKTTTSTYTDSQGVTRTSMLTVWTEKGRVFIHELLKQKHSA